MKLFKIGQEGLLSLEITNINILIIGDNWIFNSV